MNEIQRMKQLAGILNESVQSIPGLGEATRVYHSPNPDMGSPRRVPKDHPDAATSRPAAAQAARDARASDPSVGRREGSSAGGKVYVAKGVKEDSYDLEEKSTSEKQARFMAASAHDPKFAKRAGMDQSVAKEFNKADSGTEQLSKAMQHKNESSAMGLEEGSVLDVTQACDRFEGLIQQYPEDEALNIIRSEFAERGYNEHETNRIMHDVEEYLGITPFDPSEYDIMNPDDNNVITISNTDPYVDNVSGEFPEFEHDGDDDEFPIDENTFNNGYDDEHYASGKDYFPTGADSSVTRNVGPSGARQGDNPEQKRMEVAETHKQLVSNYRNFLKESRK